MRDTKNQNQTGGRGGKRAGAGRPKMFGGAGTDKRKRSIYCSTWELAYARTFLDMLRRVIEPGVPIDKDELHALQTVMSHIDYDDLPASLGGKRHGNEDHIASQLFYKTNEAVLPFDITDTDNQI